MLRLHFETGNAAFEEDELYEAGKILHILAMTIKNGVKEGVIRDINGNRIGAFKFTPEQEGVQGDEQASSGSD